jgi:hypothetical protein
MKKIFLFLLLMIFSNVVTADPPPVGGVDWDKAERDIKAKAGNSKVKLPSTKETNTPSSTYTPPTSTRNSREEQRRLEDIRRQNEAAKKAEQERKAKEFQEDKKDVNNRLKGYSTSSSKDPKDLKDRMIKLQEMNNPSNSMTASNSNQNQYPESSKPKVEKPKVQTQSARPQVAQIISPPKITYIHNKRCYVLPDDSREKITPDDIGGTWSLSNDDFWNIVIKKLQQTGLNFATTIAAIKTLQNAEKVVGLKNFLADINTKSLENVQKQINCDNPEVASRMLFNHEQKTTDKTRQQTLNTFVSNINSSFLK